MEVTSDPRYIDVRDTPFELAIAVLRERISRLPKADRDDLYELLPAILSGDDEDRESAQRAVNEILNGAPASVQMMDMTGKGTPELSKWTDFFSTRLKEARAEAGMTQKQLADASGIPQSHISRLEAGQHSATAKTTIKLARALGKAHSYFDPSAD